MNHNLEHKLDVRSGQSERLQQIAKEFNPDVALCENTHYTAVFVNSEPVGVATYHIFRHQALLDSYELTPNAHSNSTLRQVLGYGVKEYITHHLRIKPDAEFLKNLGIQS